MTLDEKADRLVTASPCLLVPWYLILSYAYAYYFENVSLVLYWTMEFLQRLVQARAVDSVFAAMPKPLGRNSETQINVFVAQSARDFFEVNAVFREFVVGQQAGKAGGYVVGQREANTQDRGQGPASRRSSELLIRC